MIPDGPFPIFIDCDENLLGSDYEILHHFEDLRLKRAELYDNT